MAKANKRDHMMKQRRKRERNEEKTKINRTIIIMVGTLLIFFIFVIIGVIIHQLQTNTNHQTAGQAGQSVGVSQPKLKINTAGQPMMGKANAPVTLVEFGDYRCIYCKQFEEKIIPHLKKDYINNGKVKFYFVNFTILGDGSKKAANASEAIYHLDPSRFWDFHAALYNNQKDESLKWVTNSLLEQIAQKSVPSLDMKKFKVALLNQTYEQQVLNDHAMAVTLGLQGTPDLFVDGKPVSDPLNYKMVKTAIEASLNGANH